MEILWWLAPAAGATTLAMIWAGWRGRVLNRRDAGRRPQTAAERDAALERMGEALAKPRRGPVRAASSRSGEPLEPSTGVALRRTR